MTVQNLNCHSGELNCHPEGPFFAWLEPNGRCRAANGVGEYWIVDADASVIEQYILNGESYELLQKTSSGQLKSQVLSGFECEVAAFFDESENLAALRQLVTT